MAVLKQVEQAAAITLMTTELNALANNANAISATAILVNVIGQANQDGYVRGKLELNLGAVAGAFTTNTGFSVWFLASVDGTNYEDGGTSVTPGRNPDVVIGPVRPVATAQRLIKKCRIPVGTHFVLIQNNGTGQALAATLNTLKLLLSTDSIV